MVAEVEPPELAQLLDAAERPRSANWSLRAALTRYAQPQPQRASAVIELLRRIEAALRSQTKVLAREGNALWTALDGSEAASPDGDVEARLVGLLRALRELDRLGDLLADWAVVRAGVRPDDAVDAVVADVTRRLDALGIPREERPPRPAVRRGG
jgi:hypothetical protein